MLGRLPQTLTQETFREKFLGTSKAFAKINGYSRCESFCGFLRGFFKKPLKARSSHAVPTYYDNQKSTAMPCFFVCIECWGVCPKPRHKKLFEKSFLELQKLCSNKRVFLSKVLWLTFLRGKGKLYSVLFKL